jgi:hypothetical protein
MAPEIENSDAVRICLPFLREAQNSDGGWGFRPDTPSRVEATCWALLALREPSRQIVGNPVAEDPARVQRARDFLQNTQLEDGSWPAAPGEEMGCWVTSLCCLALTTTGERTQNSTIESGFRWICNDWPSDSTPWRRFLARFSSERDVAPINYSYRGWGWTPETSSWVEPTSFALLALEADMPDELVGLEKRRRSLATSLLFDRMCAGGGWNAGNPMVYGAAGEPSVVPTVWALLALRGLPSREEVRLSLHWLERTTSKTQSPASAALARICLRAYGRALPVDAPQLNDLLRKNEFLSNVPVAAWAVLAHGSDFWLRNPATGAAAA